MYQVNASYTIAVVILLCLLLKVAPFVQSFMGTLDKKAQQNSIKSEIKFVATLPLQQKTRRLFVLPLRDKSPLTSLA